MNQYHIIQGLVQSQRNMWYTTDKWERQRLFIPIRVIPMYELQLTKQLFISYWMQYNIVMDILMKEVGLQSTFVQKANYSVIFSLLLCELLLLEN